jgi:ssDNA-specific exonuclease RecJ
MKNRSEVKFKMPYSIEKILEINYHSTVASRTQWAFIYNFIDKYPNLIINNKEPLSLIKFINIHNREI